MPKKSTRRSGHRSDTVSAILHELRLSDDAAELRHLIELCQRSRRTRTWLFSRFAVEPQSREKFRALLDGRPTPLDGLWSPDLQAEVISVAGRDQAADKRHGGLSSAEIWALIKGCQGGKSDPAAFILAQGLLRTISETGTMPVALWLPTLRYWTELVSDPSGTLMGELARALRLQHSQTTTTAADAVYPWKVHVLIYILQHPKPAYRVGELFDNLPEKFRRIRANGNHFVERREIRKFCEESGIARDKAAGVRSQARY